MPAPLRTQQPPYIVSRPQGHTRPSPDSEWLLTTGNGGFAMGTASGVNRRKYHALLIASTHPPVDRVSCLVGLDETLILHDDAGRESSRHHLDTHRFRTGALNPAGADLLVRFEKTPTVARWVYAVAGIEVIKELKLASRRNGCAVRYTLRGRPRNLRLLITPRVTLRDFHAVNASIDLSCYSAEARGDSMRISHEGRTLNIVCGHADAVARPGFLHDVLLDFESERRQEDVEQVFTPGWFEISTLTSHMSDRNSQISDFKSRISDLESQISDLESQIPDPHPQAADPVPPLACFILSAALEPDSPDPAIFADQSREHHLSRVRGGFLRAHPGLDALTPLVDASDDFLAPRVVDGKELTTILAGFPWFSDWGRDTMISLVGLMLTTGRLDDARGALETFARHVKDGLIPNLFDDYGGPPQYNTVDASLWFLHACREYLRAGGERPVHDKVLLPACLQVIGRYQSGTHFNIRMDPADALVSAGDTTTQLTWMDAKRDGVVFTPRHGKPVEINALWHHGLLCVAECIGTTDTPRAHQLRALAARVADSFRAKFWNEQERRLFDCLQPCATGGLPASAKHPESPCRDRTQQAPALADKQPVAHDPGPCATGGSPASATSTGFDTPLPHIRPNQIFAASLEFSPLTPDQRRAVVENVKTHLLTPRGLRTLASSDPAYCPRFDGDMMRRDRAYHNGTVWPWLIGPYCEALLRAGDFSHAAREEARHALQPILDSLTDACLGQIAEVYDADEPRRAQGCVAQAWSVAEVLRAAALIYEGRP